MKRGTASWILALSIASQAVAVAGPSIPFHGTPESLERAIKDLRKTFDKRYPDGEQYPAGCGR